MTSTNRQNVTGITISSVWKTYFGFTLFAPLGGNDVYLIDMKGEVVHKWKVPQKPACYGRLLPNGHLLFAGRNDNSELAGFRGSGGFLMELDWNGNMIWEYQDDYLHHSFCRLRDGKMLVLKWVPVPGGISSKVRGGIKGTERDGVMWGDAIEEITPFGGKTWEWKAHEHLDVEKDVICPLDPRDEWTHANYISVSGNGNILISFCRTNTIAIIDRSTGDICWRWGAPYELGHQNGAEFLPEGNILVFDNGLHPPGFDFGYSRILEVNPENDRVVWDYHTASFSLFYSSVMGGCQRLPNGNTLICESINGRIFEVTPACEIVWEYISPHYHDTGIFGHSNIMFSAFRYGPDYEGLAGIESGS
ncbi:MAG: aryl-sulfate sulfotransferase [Actinobacteria bacterium]|nr:aryl-sulfate sulfotransferase [Actinomycetota bacterium]